MKTLIATTWLTYMMISLTMDSYSAYYLGGGTIFFGFVAALSVLFVLFGVVRLQQNIAEARARRKMLKEDSERFYLTDFQAKRGKWDDSEPATGSFSRWID